VRASARDASGTTVPGQHDGVRGEQPAGSVGGGVVVVALTDAITPADFARAADGE
jgi:hypothetical protein